MFRNATFLLLLLPLHNLDAQTRLPRPPKPTSVKPLRVTTQALTAQTGLGGIGGYIAVAISLEYERFITEPKWLSATLKAAGYIGGTVGFGGEQDPGEVWSRNSGYFLAPGLRFHPFRNRTFADLGIGITFPAGVGKRRDNAKDAVPFNQSQNLSSDFFGAALGELTLNFRGGSRRGIFGFVVQAGRIYSNAAARNYNFRYEPPSHSENDPLYMQVGIRFGTGW